MFYGQMAETTDSVELPDCDYESQLELFRFMAPDHPSMIGCQQAQELGIITINVQEVSDVSAPSAAQQTAQHVSLSKATVLKERVVQYSDKFMQSIVLYYIHITID